LKFGNASSTAAQILGATPSTVTETAGASASTLNSDAGYTTYQSGANIDFDGLRVVMQDGAAGPRNGDVFTVAQARQLVLSNQSYVSGGAINVEGLQFSLRNGAAAPASGDLFSVQTGVQFQGNSGLQTIAIGDGQTVKTNLPGGQVFSGPTTDLFASVKSLISALNGNYGGGIQQSLTDVNAAVDQVAVAQGEVGALENQLGTTQTSLDATKTFLATVLSSNEDVDMVAALSSLTLQQQVIQAAGTTLNDIFKSSLLNYLPATG
jgi:flagellar hook-associated protein 3 FlgL